MIRFDVKEPARLKRAHGFLKRMIAEQRTMFKKIEAEEDDDHEWLANANQTPLREANQFKPETIRLVLGMMDEWDAALDGKRVIGHWRIPGERGRESQAGLFQAHAV